MFLFRCRMNNLKCSQKYDYLAKIMAKFKLAYFNLLIYKGIK